MPFAFEFSSEAATQHFFNAEMECLIDLAADLYQLKVRAMCVAVSGGADSLAMLLMAHNFAQKNDMSMECVTVDHGLREHSMDEAIFVGLICEELGVKQEILSWNHKYDLCNLDFGKIENLARNARYQLIEDFCSRRSMNILLTGHTWNDQLETFEMRKDSGSAEVGLACMSRVRSISDRLKLLRPVLHFSKNHLENFLRAKGIRWKDDPMNHMEIFKRVSHRVRIGLQNSSDIQKKTLKIKELGKKRAAVEKAAVSFLKDSEKCNFSEFGYAILNMNFLLAEQFDTQKEIFRRSIWNIGGKKYPTAITEKKLSNIMSGKINTLGRCLIKIRRGKIFLFRENRNLPRASLGKIEEKKIIFDNRFSMTINKKLNNCVIECPRGDDLYQLKKTFWSYGRKLPLEAIRALPCVYQNNKMMCSSVGNVDGCSQQTQPSVARFFFTNVAGLFDVFL